MKGFDTLPAGALYNPAHSGGVHAHHRGASPSDEAAAAHACTTHFNPSEYSGLTRSQLGTGGMGGSAADDMGASNAPRSFGYFNVVQEKPVLEKPRVAAGMAHSNSASSATSHARAAHEMAMASLRSDAK